MNIASKGTTTCIFTGKSPIRYLSVSTGAVVKVHQPKSEIFSIKALNEVQDVDETAIWDEINCLPSTQYKLVK